METELEKLVEEYYLLVEILRNDKREEEYFKKYDEFFAHLHSYVSRNADDNFSVTLHDACVKVGKRLGRPVMYWAIRDQLAEYAYSLLSPEEQREKGYL